MATDRQETMRTMFHALTGAINGMLGLSTIEALSIVNKEILSRPRSELTGEDYQKLVAVVALTQKALQQSLSIATEHSAELVRVHKRKRISEITIGVSAFLLGVLTTYGYLTWFAGA